MLVMATLYYENIIKPIEKECIKLQEKIRSKKFLDFLLRPTYKNQLTFYEQLLSEKYIILCEILFGSTQK